MIPPRIKQLLRRLLHMLPHPLQRVAVYWYWRTAPIVYRIVVNALRSTSYRRWIALYDTLSEEDRRAIAGEIRSWTNPPLISVVVPMPGGPRRHIRAALDSVLGQLYPCWELCILDGPSTASDLTALLAQYAGRDARIKVVRCGANGDVSAAFNRALAVAPGSFVALLDHRGLLASHALYMIAREIIRDPCLDMIYTDEDKVSRRGRRYDPHFKSDWNPDLFLAQNMVSHLAVYRTALVREVGGFRPELDGAHDYDFALRIIERTQPQRIRHIPHILYHCYPGAGPVRKRDAAEAARSAVADHLRRRQIAADVRIAARTRIRQVSYALQSEPLVSIIVPTKDRRDLLSRCVSGVLERTRYRNLELLIVDNRSEEAETHAYLDDIAADARVRVLRYDEPFNFSLLNNWAVKQALGEVLLLLNNDTEVIGRDWLRHLVANACRPEVGAVGAKLIYPNGRVQHAGVILGIGGVAGHVHLGRKRNDRGYFGRALLQQNFSAVTAACIAMRRTVFDEIGGFNGDLRVALNDVDLCVRIRQRGYLIVWTPLAELYHHESASRGSDLLPARYAEFRREFEYMRSKWGPVLDRDPYYNPNLSLQHLSIRLAFPPRSTDPWGSKGEQLMPTSLTT